MKRSDAVKNAAMPDVLVRVANNLHLTPFRYTPLPVDFKLLGRRAEQKTPTIAFTEAKFSRKVKGSQHVNKLGLPALELRHDDHMVLVTLLGDTEAALIQHTAELKHQGDLPEMDHYMPYAELLTAWSPERYKTMRAVLAMGLGVS